MREQEEEDDGGVSDGFSDEGDGASGGGSASGGSGSPIRALRNRGHRLSEAGVEAMQLPQLTPLPAGYS
jgi:hypothetical protein